MGKKNWAKPLQHPEAEHSLFENYSLSSFIYHPKIIGDILKTGQKPKASVLVRSYMINDNENEAEYEK